MSKEVSKGQLLPVKFDMANQNMTAPNCEPLPVFFGDGYFISCWEISNDQLKEITENRRIWLGIVGGQPPVWLSTDNPFIDTNDWSEVIEVKDGQD